MNVGGQERWRNGRDEKRNVTTRKCENWLLTYRDYILPVTDAPESFVFWSGIYALASAIRRQVWIPKKYLGLWECYPYVYLMFVGPPGIRKTTTIDHGAGVLLAQTESITEGPSVFTKEAVVERMQKVKDNSLYLVIGEFSDIFQKQGKDRNGMYEFFTSMFDGKQKYDSATKSSGSYLLGKPCLNFFSATTPGWITDNMPEGVITGGFASRVIFVYEEKPRIEKMFFDDVERDPTLEEKLLHDLRHISTQISGEFTFTAEARDFAAHWSSQAPNPDLSKNPKLGGYLNRKKTHVAKLAQLHSLATKDDLIITKTDWEFGIHSIETTESGLGNIFGGIGKNKYVTDMERMVNYIDNMNFFTLKPVYRHEVLRNFQSAAEPRQLEDLIRYAIDAKYIRADVEEGTNEIIFISTRFEASQREKKEPK